MQLGKEWNVVLFKKWNYKDHVISADGKFASLFITPANMEKLAAHATRRDVQICGMPIQ